MPKEVFDQPRPWPEQGAEPSLTPINLEELSEVFFEKFTENFCSKRAIVNNLDGSRTIIETYHIYIENLLKVNNKDLVEFFHTAAILGYRSPMGSIFIPDMGWSPETGIEPAVVVVLEKNI